MPLIYCDHNYVVTALQEPKTYHAHLQQLVATGTLTFTLAPMHWVEAAEDTNLARGDAKAAFMDSLHPQWLFDRRSIQRREVAAVFFNHLGVATNTSQMMGSVSDVIADLVGQQAERDSRAFVAHLRDIGPNHPLERSLQQAFDTNQHNTELYRQGKLTPAITQEVERLYVKQLLPAATPAGILIDDATKNQFVDTCQMEQFPSIVLEHRATRDNWAHGRQLSRNNFMDQQHLMALPYVDFFLTDDAKLTSLIGRITIRLPFRIATVLTKTQFDTQYP